MDLVQYLNKNFVAIDVNYPQMLLYNIKRQNKTKNGSYKICLKLTL